MSLKELIIQTGLKSFYESDDVVLAILDHTKSIEFKKGEILTRQGDYSTKVGIIVSGIARWYREDADQVENVLQFFGEGDFVTSPFSFFSGDPAHGTLQAIEDLEIYYITKEDFESIGKLYPEFLAQSYKALSHIIMQFWSEKNRLLRLSAIERYLFFQERYAKIAHRISLGNVSAYLGMRQSSLSRVRREITENGW